MCTEYVEPTVDDDVANMQYFIVMLHFKATSLN